MSVRSLEGLRPLAESAAYDDYELELKSLVIRLFYKHLLSSARDINNYGKPDNGSDALRRRWLASNNLIALSETSRKNSADIAKYLALCITYQNQKRGLNLFEKYLRSVWDGDFVIHRIYIHKNQTGNYPYSCLTEKQLKDRGVSDSDIEQDYILTSRISIEVLGKNAENFPIEAARYAQRVLPARIFLTNIGRTQSGAYFSFGFGGHLHQNITTENTITCRF